jgi:hypothetical protein
MTEVQAPSVISATYAYHPADETPDLYVLTEVLKRYHVAHIAHRPAIDPPLEWDIKQRGVLKPLRLYTNGTFGILGDGNHRLRIALKLGIDKLPVQILPDNFKRMASQKGYPMLEPVVEAWVKENLWSHSDHTVTRHIIGGESSGGIKASKFIKCVCSCDATWKEEA